MIINVLMIYFFFYQLSCFEDTYSGRTKSQIPRKIVLAHSFIPTLISLKIVMCVSQSVGRCVNDIKGKKNTIPVLSPPCPSQEVDF